MKDKNFYGIMTVRDHRINYLEDFYHSSFNNFEDRFFEFYKYEEYFDIETGFYFRNIPHEKYCDKHEFEHYKKVTREPFKDSELCLLCLTGRE